MKKLKLLFSSLLICSALNTIQAQDIGVINIQSPSGSGCNLGNQTVQVDVRNFSSTTLTGSFDVTYQLDGNTPVTQSDLNLLSFAGSSTRTFTFVTQLNLTGNYGTHTLKVYTERAGDTDNSNDTTILTFTNYAPSNAGTLSKNDTVCKTANMDTLVLSGSVGSVLEWQFNNGGGWIPLAVTDTFFVYNNLTTTTRYRVVVQNGTCTSAMSNEITIQVDEPADAGILQENKTVCLGSAGDTLYLTNYFGYVTKWQSDTGNGVWFDITNTTDTLTYPSPVKTIRYRVIVDTGVCNADTSNIVTITVVPATVGGNLIKNDTVCSNNNYDTIVLTNHVGNILQWESSDDNGFTWVPIVNTDTFQIYNNLANSRMYRVLVEATGCSQLYSDTVKITTVAQPVGGTIQEDKSICGGTNNDTLILTGYTSNVIKWQSNNGGGWVDIANTNDSLFVSNLLVTTSYRAIVGNGICPNDTSSTATLTVIATTIGGNIIQSDSVCLGINRDTLHLVGHVGDIRWWERSTDDGASWTPIANTDTFQIYNNLTQTTWYRVLVEGTSCPNDYSDTAIITTYIPQVTITPQDTTIFCDGDSVQLDATTGYSSYLWNTTETSPSITVKTSNTYKVTITDFRGCMQSDSINVTVNPLPVANAGDDVSISLGESTILMGSGGTTYLWSPGASLDDVNSQTPTATPQTTTTYTLLVIDNNGCQDQDSVIVTVVKDYNFSPKNVITPNGDGFNDTWKVDNLIAYPGCTVTIFNRYGSVVYQTKGYDNSWDGTSNGERVSDGTYYYVITCDGSDETYKGNITVLTK